MVGSEPATHLNMLRLGCDRRTPTALMCLPLLANLLGEFRASTDLRALEVEDVDGDGDADGKAGKDGRCVGEVFRCRSDIGVDCRRIMLASERHGSVLWVALTWCGVESRDTGKEVASESITSSS